MDSGNAALSYHNNSGRNILDVPSIIDEVLADFDKEKIEVLLISGDMTKDGEKQSHVDFVKKLQPLIGKGVRVYVIPGNHDINVPVSVGFRENETYLVDNVSEDEFVTIYAECGYNSALSRDTASLSYVAELREDTWLLAIDASLYKGNHSKTITEGRVSPDTEQWILKSLEKAKQKKVRVLGMMHHGLTEHIMLQDMIFPQYLVDDWRRIAALLADNGVEFVFTGHFHSHDITAFTSNKGNTLYDIETGALSSYPYPYRLADLTDEGLDIRTQNVKATANNPDLFEKGKHILKRVSADLVKQKLKERGYKASKDLMDKIADVGSDVIILHMQGDEVIDDDLKAKMKDVARQADIPIDLSPEYLQLDFPPADNNVFLFFGK